MEQVPGDLNRYIADLFAQEDSILQATSQDMEQAGIPGIHVKATEGKLLHVLALIQGANRILEIGTLGGYSAICLARALPEGGRLITLELDEHHAEVARHNIARAGLSDKVEIRVGPASVSLAQMAAEKEAPFDLVFIDADKEGYVEYLEKVLGLVREGGLILGDNTLPEGVLDPAIEGGTKDYNRAVAANADLISILIPILKTRSIDGLLISIKRTVALNQH